MVAHLWLLLLLLEHATATFAQSDGAYDSSHHFIVPPTPIAPQDFSEAVNYTAGTVITFTWATTLVEVSFSIYQEGNAYYPVLADYFTGSSCTWNGSTAIFPNGDVYGNIQFLGIRDQYATETAPLSLSRYFRLVDKASSSLSSPVAATSAVVAASSTTNTSPKSITRTTSIAGAATSASENPSNPESSKRIVAIGAGVGVGVGVSFIIAIGVILFLLCRRNKAKVNIKTWEPPSYGQPDAKMYSLRQQQNHHQSPPMGLNGNHTPPAELAAAQGLPNIHHKSPELTELTPESSITQ